MAQNPSDPPGEPPRAEPEIIPPGTPLPRSVFDGFADSGFAGAYFARRIYIKRVGPFGITLIALAIGIVLAAILMLFFGALLILIPVFGLLVIAAMLSGGMRTHLRRRP